MVSAGGTAELESGSNDRGIGCAGPQNPCGCLCGAVFVERQRSLTWKISLSIFERSLHESVGHSRRQCLNGRTSTSSGVGSTTVCSRLRLYTSEPMGTQRAFTGVKSRTLTTAVGCTGRWGRLFQRPRSLTGAAKRTHSRQGKRRVSCLRSTRPVLSNFSDQAVLLRMSPVCTAAAPDLEPRVVGSQVRYCSACGSKRLSLKH